MFRMPWICMPLSKANTWAKNVPELPMPELTFLLITADPIDHKRAWQGLTRSYQYDLQFRVTCGHSADRITQLEILVKQPQNQPWFGSGGLFRTPRCCKRDCRTISYIAVRDEAHLLPIKLNPDQRIVVILPQPADLTPADTSSFVVPALAEAIRKHHSNLEEIVVPFATNRGRYSENTRTYPRSNPGHHWHSKCLCCPGSG